MRFHSVRLDLNGIALMEFRSFFRILESYDSFLIGLPLDMRSDDYQFQRPNANHFTGQAIDEMPPSKRKRIELGPSSSDRIIQIRKQHSVAHSSKSMKKIGPQITIHKMVSSRSTDLVAPSTLPLSGNQLKITEVTSLHQATNNNVTKNGRTPTNTVSTASKTPDERNRMKSMIPITATPMTSTPILSVNAHSTPILKSILKVKSSRTMLEDPLKADDAAPATSMISSTQISSGNAHSIPIPKPILKVKGSKPADPLKTHSVTLAKLPMELKNKPISQHQANQRLSISLPARARATAVTAQAEPTTKPNSIVTRSRSNSVHQRQLYKCDLCTFATEVQDNFLRHHVNHTSEKPQTCKICRKRFAEKSILLAHMRENHHDLHSDLAYWDTN